MVLFSEELIVLKQYLRLTQQKLPGLYASQYYHYNSFGVLGAALASHANILDALNFIQKYIDLTFTPFKIIMQEQEDNLCGFYLNRYGLTGDCLEFYLLRDLAFLRNMTKDMLPDSWQDLGVSIDIALDMADLEKQQILAQFFYWPIRFGCRQSAIYGNKTKLNIPIHLGMKLPLKLQSSVKLVSKRKQYRWNNRVEDILLSSERLLSQEKVAKMLCCSERTLRRHLQQEGYLRFKFTVKTAKDSVYTLSIKELI